MLEISRLEKHWFLDIDGELFINAAPELKQVLVDWSDSGRDLYLDLERAEAIDIAALQLFRAANCRAADAGVAFVSRVSEAVATIARDAGFDPFPGAGAPGAVWPK